MTGLPEKIVAIDRALREAALPHAFGGALALAWCTRRARGTIDIDLNVFAGVDRATEVLSALPDGVDWSEADGVRLTDEGQVRVWWEGTPVDIFLSTTAFHDEAAKRIDYENFAGADVPFLACTDLAVFKAFFNRTQDWADLEQMVDMGTVDVDRLLGVLVRYVGPTDERVDRVRELGS
ncbi:MAG: hypothetical protein ABSG81_09500 [Acidimicrobiales bacterium]